MAEKTKLLKDSYLEPLGDSSKNFDLLVLAKVSNDASRFVEELIYDY